MSTSSPDGGSVKTGEVRSVRELSTGVQGQVCLGASPARGYATITIVSDAPEVLAALKALKDALRAEAKAYLSAVVDDQLEWERSK